MHAKAIVQRLSDLTRSASQYVRQLIQKYAPHAVSLLKIACGTVQYLSRLRHHYIVEGLERRSLGAGPRLFLGVVLHQTDMLAAGLSIEYNPKEPFGRGSYAACKDAV